MFKIMIGSTNAASFFNGLDYSYSSWDKVLKAYTFLKKDSPHVNFTIVPA